MRLYPVSLPVQLADRFLHTVDVISEVEQGRSLYDVMEDREGVAFTEGEFAKYGLDVTESIAVRLSVASYLA